ncbi:MAG: RagB/SusD family nutrient uptake outer membrane protein [Bacteroidota bacterium]
MKNRKYNRPVLQTVLYLLLCLLGLSSCKKYLDAKPDKKLAVPESLADAQALLDNYAILNQFYPATGLESDDDHYLLPEDYNSLGIEAQQVYQWDKDAANYDAWTYLYTDVLYANLSLETTESVTVDITNEKEWKNVKGQALFYRAFAFFQVAEYFASPYNTSSAANTPGIPLRLTSDVNEAIARASLEQSFARITGDLKEAVQLLPVSNTPVARPAKPAAYGLLARIYLTMNDFEHAGLYADSCLQLYNMLMDYNSIDTTAGTPFTVFNKEVIWQCNSLGSSAVYSPTAKTDSVLYNSYAGNDLRKQIFFSTSADGTHSFKGGYNGARYYNFIGIATDEMYLVRAECEAREGKLVEALSDVNTLLEKRWLTGTFVPVTAASANDALKIILSERRKELTFRNSRWFDLRRLNEEGKFTVTLKRDVNGAIYELKPGDSKYTFLIPPAVIGISGMEQNVRE